MIAREDSDDTRLTSGCVVAVDVLAPMVTSQCAVTPGLLLEAVDEGCKTMGPRLGGRGANLNVHAEPLGSVDNDFGSKE
jgi:hypothetical protein